MYTQSIIKNELTSYFLYIFKDEIDVKQLIFSKL